MSAETAAANHPKPGEDAPSTSPPTVYLVVPFRIRFAPTGVLSWVRGALPVFWHHWSERTDIRRIPLRRRWSVFWNWFVQRPGTLALPLESTAVEWWLARLLRSGTWTWDREFAHQVGVPERARGPAHDGDVLRSGPRELLVPRAWVQFLDDELSELSEDYAFIPPVTAVHARALSTLVPRPTELSLSESTEPPLPMSLQAIRLHAFRFGDGALSLELRLVDAADEQRARSILRQACRHLDRVTLRFPADAGGENTGTAPEADRRRSTPHPRSRRSTDAGGVLPHSQPELRTRARGP